MPDPPTNSGIELEAGDEGARITLPRLYSTGDILTAVLAAAIAVWIAVWLDSMAPGRGVSALGRTLMAAVGLFFAALAVSEAWPMLARRVLEDRGDAVALGRRLGVRTLFFRTIPKTVITSVDRLPEPGTDAVNAPYVMVRTDDDVHRIGKHLGEPELAWLEEALRTVVGWTPPG